MQNKPYINPRAQQFIDMFKGLWWLVSTPVKWIYRKVRK